MKLSNLAALIVWVFFVSLGTSETLASDKKFTPIKSSMIVTEVTGTTEYSYDSTGWKTLTAGKILQPGASVRAGKKSNVVLKSVDTSLLIKVSSETQVHLTLETSTD